MSAAASPSRAALSKRLSAHGMHRYFPPAEPPAKRAKPAAKLPLGAAWDVDAWRAKACVALAARAACEGAARHARSPVGCATLFMVVKFVVKTVVCLKTVCATLRRSWLSIPRRGDRT